MNLYCEKCGKTMDEKEFYTSHNIEKYPPNGKLHMCKKCLTMHVDNWDPETYLWILQEIDVPYIPKTWNSILEKYCAEKDPAKITGLSVLGKYLSQMRMKQLSKYRWADTEALAQQEHEAAVAAMKVQGMSDKDIEANLAIDRTPERPRFTPVGEPEYTDPEQVEDEFSSQLTDDDKKMLRMKWGTGYTCEQWVRMEQLYNDFLNSYDIQTAGHKDTLIMVCKASLKANELMNAGDVEDAQKMIRVYDSLMKSGNFQGVQNKNVQGEGIDSVGEIVRIAEKQGFIPRYYIDSPKDSVDKILADLQHYTKTLVVEELNLGNMIEAAVAANMEDKKREEKIVVDDSDDDEIAVDEYQDNQELTDEDYIEYSERQQALKEEDEMNNGT